MRFAFVTVECESEPVEFCACGTRRRIRSKTFAVLSRPQSLGGFCARRFLTDKYGRVTDAPESRTTIGSQIAQQTEQRRLSGAPVT
jgi:hypothetical protein